MNEECLIDMHELKVIVSTAGSLNLLFIESGLDRSEAEHGLYIILPFLDR